MRINIPANRSVQCKEIRALYLIDFALRLCRERMIVPTLQFFAGRYGYKLVPK